jgi:oligopeptide/dipeptide ABC transporter ATP-binding protein
MSDTILEVRHLKKYFPIRRGLLRRVVGQVRAVDDISFAIRRGETLALVGESGCGKTTAARCILRALAPSAGQINFNVEGQTHDLAALKRPALRRLRRHMQMVFQDPFSSLNPRMMVGDIIGEPLLINGMASRAERRKRVAELMDLVQLPAAYMNRFPHAFSGGQRQRIGIARALSLNPQLIVADEPVSALDVSVQAQILNLMLDLQDRLKLTYLFVAHDLSVVKHVADRVAVMYVGRIAEIGETEALYDRPLHPYTEALLSAAPVPVPGEASNRIVLEREIADPANPPPGCSFNPRCRYATDLCRSQRPDLVEAEPGRLVACHHAATLNLRGIGTE